VIPSILAVVNFGGIASSNITGLISRLYYTNSTHILSIEGAGSI
jgi:hypothetical protein